MKGTCVVEAVILGWTGTLEDFVAGLVAPTAGSVGRQLSLFGGPTNFVSLIRLGIDLGLYEKGTLGCR